MILFSTLHFAQFGELGIDFVGLESRSPPPPEQVSEGTLSSLNVSAAAAADQLTSVDTPAPLTYSQLQQRYNLMISSEYCDLFKHALIFFQI